MIRTISPLDLIRLIFSGMGKLPNRAKPLGKMLSPAPLSMADVLSPKPLLGLAPSRHTCVQTRGLRVKGLVLARDLGSSAVWEVDSLALTPEPGHSATDLLNGLIISAGQRGVDRLFLRVADDSPDKDEALAAGFTFYLNELLFRLDRRSKEPAPVTESETHLRPITPADEFNVFQLYSAIYPFPVRETEGQTLEQWRDARPRYWNDPPSCQFMVILEGAPEGWVGARAQGNAAFLSVMLRPGADVSPDLVLQLIESHMTHLDAIFCLASEFDGPLMNALEARGYTLVRTFARAVRKVTANIKRPTLVPVGAE